MVKDDKTLVGIGLVIARFTNIENISIELSNHILCICQCLYPMGYSFATVSTATGIRVRSGVLSSDLQTLKCKLENKKFFKEASLLSLKPEVVEKINIIKKYMISPHEEINQESWIRFLAVYITIKENKDITEKEKLEYILEKQPMYVPYISCAEDFLLKIKEK